MFVLSLQFGCKSKIISQYKLYFKKSKENQFPCPQLPVLFSPTCGQIKCKVRLLSPKATPGHWVGSPGGRAIWEWLCLEQWSPACPARLGQLAQAGPPCL